MKRIAFLFTIIAASFAIQFADVAPAQATMVAALDDAQLVEFSDVIALVRIVDTESFWFNDHTILTRVRANVSELYKGNADETVEFYIRGGVIGDLAQTVEGEFNAKAGDTLVVFLEKIPRYNNSLMLLGLSQGAFIVDKVPMTRSDRRLPVRVHRNHFVPCQPDSAICGANTIDDIKSAILKYGN